jgi:hypothetical protein
MSATTFVRMPNAKQMAMMGIPDLPEAAFGGDIPPMQRKALVRAMGIRPQGGGGGLKAVVAVVAAVAIPFVAPAIAASIGVSGAIAGAAASAGISAATAATVGSVVGSAIVGAGLGAVSAAATGGDVGRGALMGGLGSGISGYFAAPQVAPTAGGVPTSTALQTPGTNTIGIANMGDGTAAVATFDPATKSYMLANGTAVDPSAIAYGGQVESGLAQTLSSSNNVQAAANAIQSSGTLAVNTPVALGGNTAALGTSSYYNANLNVPVVSGSASAAPDFAVQSAPAYAQSGQVVSAATERAAAAQAAFSPTYASNVAPAPAASTSTTGGATTGGATTGGPAQAAPATLSEALKQKLTNPSSQADFVLRAAGQIVGSQIAGDGLSDEEKALVAQQKAELESLRTTNKALFDQKISQALEFAGESRYFDPETFGLRASRQVQNAGARAKQEGLRGIDSRRAGLRRAEERRYNLGIDTGAQTAFLQGMDTAEQNKLRVKQAGLAAIPNVGPEASNMQYASYLGNMYDSADRRRRAAAGDVGDLLGSFTGGAKSSGTTIKIG